MGGDKLLRLGVAQRTSHEDRCARSLVLLGGVNGRKGSEYCYNQLSTAVCPRQKWEQPVNSPGAPVRMTGAPLLTAVNQFADLLCNTSYVLLHLVFPKALHGPTRLGQEMLHLAISRDVLS